MIVPIFTLLVLFPGTRHVITVADEDFTVFLRRFVQNEQFRMSRVVFVLPVLIGSSCDEDQKTSTWAARAFRKHFVVPLTRDELTAQGLSQKITQLSSNRVQLFQFHDEADSYLLTYKFQEIRGRWFLVRFEDASC